MTEIAHGTIKVDLDDAEAVAGLRKLDAAFDRTMSRIEKEHAVATVEANIAPLEQKVVNAKRQLKELEGQKATVEVDGDTDQLDAAIKEARLAIKRLEGEKATIELDLKGQDKVLAAQRAIAANREKLQKEADAALARHQRLEDQAAKDNVRRVNSEARVRTSLNNQRIKEMRDAESEAIRIDRDTTQRASKLANLQKKYAKSVREVERQSFRKTPLGREARIELKLDQNAAKEKMLLLKAELNALGGHPPVEIKVDVDRRDRVGQWFLGLIDKFRNLGTAGQGLRGSIGPISASLSSLFSAALVLAPALVAVAGALGALIAVAASAAAGLGALALGFVGGLIPAAVGAILVIKPLIKQFADVKKAQDAYTTAVNKYGEGTKKALAAHHALRNVLGHVSDETARAVENAGNLSKRWQELTAPAKAVAWTTIGEALRTAAADLTTFGKGTNRVFAAAGKAVQGWLKGLRSPEARNILGNLMGNFAKTVGPLARGLGSIFTWLGRIASVASNFLPGIAKGFAAWAKGIADAAKNTPGVEKTLTRMVKSLSSVGRLFVSSGKFLAAFFDGGVESGQNLADSLSNTLDKWTAFLKSTKGKKELKDFFKNAVDDAGKLAQAISDISTAFYAVSKAAEPVIGILSEIWGFLSRFLSFKTPDWGIKAQRDAIEGAKSTFTDFWDRTKSIFGYIKSQAGVVGGAIASVGRAIGTAARSIAGLASKSVKIGVSFASGGLDKAKSAIGSVAKLGGQVVKIGFQFASGAVTAAIGLVRRLLSLGGRAVSIGASFAVGVISGAIALVRRLLSFSGRVVSIGARFAAGVISGGIGLVRKLLGFAGRVVSIGARFAGGVITGAINLLNQLMAFAGRVVDVAVHISIPKIPSLKSLIPHASGTKASQGHMALVGEGGGPEILANRKSGAVSVVKDPMLLKLQKDDYVIPTEQKYRARGRNLMSQWAKEMGIPGFKSGKAPKPLSEHGKSVARGVAHGILKKKEIKNPGAYTEIDRVHNLQDSEAEQRAKINIAESKLKEPSSFLLPAGEDAEGNPIFTVNTAEVNRWTNDLNAMRDMYNTLLTTMEKLKTAVKKAINAVRTAMTTADKNLHIIATLEDKERAIISKKGSSKVAIQKAKERLGVYKDEANAQKKVREDASSSLSDLKEEDKYTGIQYRIDQDTVARDEYVTDAASVAAMASAEAASAAPTPKRPDAPEPFDPFGAENLAGSALEAEAALTAIGQGNRTPQQIITDQIANNQAIINTAKGLLADADPTNDASAYQAIVSAAGQISSLQGTPDTSAPANLGSESFAFGAAQGGLFSGMGNNFLTGGRASVAMGPSGGGAFGPSGGNLLAAGGSGTTINVVNNYKTQPVDPHTWSRNVLFELQAAG